MSEFDTALHLAYQTHPELDTVFFGLDLNILIRPDSQRDVELPMYLYNTNPFDDVQYFLNKETYIQVAKLLVNRLNGGTTTLDNAYVWDGSHEFSREHSLEVYYRLPDVSPPEPKDTYLAAAKENLAVVTGWAKAHPDTQFHVWFAPYSILYWDNVNRLGRTDAYLAALELAWQELTQYDNITVHSFLARDCLLYTSQDFWGRWHITLSRFFRSCVYIPLGGNRRGMAVTCRNIMVIFLLSGLWHGAGDVYKRQVTASARPRDGIDFFPLSVDFEEKLYAVGRIRCV